MENEKEEQLKEELKEVLDISKKMIKKFIGEVFGKEKLDKVNTIFEELTFGIDDNEKNGINGIMGYWDIKEGIFLSKCHLENDKNKIEVIATLIHEIQHALSYMMAEEEKGFIIDEAFAELFSEMVINYWIQQGEEISYISKKEYKMLKENGYIGSSYIEEVEFLRSILYPLQEKGKDLEAIEGHILGNSEDSFYDICATVLGKEICNVLKELEGDGIPDVKGINAKNLIEILDNYFDSKIDDEYAKYKKEIKGKNLYSTGSKILTQVYYDKFIQQYIKTIGHDIESEKDLQDLIYKLEDKTENQYENYTLTKYMDSLIYSWYLKCNGDMEKFKMILDLSDRISFEQLLLIINDEKDKNINFEYLLNKIEEYKCDINEESLDYLIDYYDNHKYRDKLADMCKSLNENSIYDLPIEELDFFKSYNLSIEQEKKVFKYFYSLNRQDNVRNMLEILEEKGILDIDLENLNGDEYILQSISIENIAQGIGYELSMLEDLQLIIDMQKEVKPNKDVNTVRQKILENIDREEIAFFVEEALLTIDMNYNGENAYEDNEHYLTNTDEIIKNIEDGNFKDIELKSRDEILNINLFIDDEEITKILFKPAFEQFYKDINAQQSFNNNIQDLCLEVLNKEVELDYKKKIIQYVKNRLETDSELNENNKKAWQNLIKNFETDLNLEKQNEPKEIKLSKELATEVSCDELNSVIIKIKKDMQKEEEKER